MSIFLPSVLILGWWAWIARDEFKRWRAQRRKPANLDMQRVSVKEVILFRGFFNEAECDAIAQSMNRLPSTSLLLILPPDKDLEMLDERQMAAAGWRRVVPAQREAERSAAVAELNQLASSISKDH